MCISGRNGRSYNPKTTGFRMSRVVSTSMVVYLIYTQFFRIEIPTLEASDPINASLFNLSTLDRLSLLQILAPFSVCTFPSILLFRPHPRIDLVLYKFHTACPAPRLLHLLESLPLERPQTYLHKIEMRVPCC